VREKKVIKSIARKKIGVSALVVAAALLSLSAAEAKEAGVKLGVLKCDVEAGTSFIFGSARDVDCVYSPSGDGPAEKYAGTIEKFGIDIGYIDKATMVWAVLAPTEDVEAGALTGSYAGATADVAVGAGLGANVLVGGGNSVTLQPVSINGAEGVNLAVGLGVLKLDATQ
jgi:hypothetical protein